MYSFRLFMSLGLLGASLAAPPGVFAAPQSCDSRVNNTHSKLLECVTLDGVREHQAAFQAIADANNGIRTSGTPGYDASVDYVVGVVSRPPATMSPCSPSSSRRSSRFPHRSWSRSPAPAGPIANNILSYSGSGDVTAAVSTCRAITRLRRRRFRRLPGRQHRPDQPRRLHVCHQGDQCL